MISILIPHIKSRDMTELMKRLEHADVEVLIDDSAKPLWMKRNNLYAIAKGEYCASVDDDDMVSEDYCKALLDAAKQGCDCVSLLGVIDYRGKKEAMTCSISYDHYRLKTRTACHLNLIRTEIARAVKFKPAVNIEKQWAIEIRALLQTETKIKTPIYTYNA